MELSRPDPRGDRGRRPFRDAPPPPPNVGGSLGTDAPAGGDTVAVVTATEDAPVADAPSAEAMAVEGTSTTEDASSKEPETAVEDSEQ